MTPLSPRNRSIALAVFLLIAAFGLELLITTHTNPHSLANHLAYWIGLLVELKLLTWIAHLGRQKN